MSRVVQKWMIGVAVGAMSTANFACTKASNPNVNQLTANLQPGQSVIINPITHQPMIIHQAPIPTTGGFSYARRTPVNPVEIAAAKPVIRPVAVAAAKPVIRPVAVAAAKPVRRTFVAKTKPLLHEVAMSESPKTLSAGKAIAELSQASLPEPELQTISQSPRVRGKKPPKNNYGAAPDAPKTDNFFDESGATPVMNLPQGMKKSKHGALNGDEANADTTRLDSQVKKIPALAAVVGAWHCADADCENDQITVERDFKTVTAERVLDFDGNKCLVRNTGKLIYVDHKNPYPEFEEIEGGNSNDPKQIRATMVSNTMELIPSHENSPNCDEIIALHNQGGHKVLANVDSFIVAGDHTLILQGRKFLKD